MKNKIAGHLSLFIIGLLIIINSPDVISFSLDFSDIREISSITIDILKGSLQSVNFIRNHGSDSDELDFPFIKKVEKTLLNKIINVNERLQNMENQIDQRANDVIDVILEELPQRLELSKTLETLDNYMSRVHKLYDDFMAYSNDPVTNHTKIAFANECVSPSYQALPDIIANIRQLVVPKYTIKPKENLFVQLAQPVLKEAELRVCNEKQSPQQLLYNLYKVIMLTEIQGFTMMQFSYTILSANGDGKDKYMAERNRTTTEYESSVYETLRAIKTAMAFAPRDLWRCDPSKHVEGDTYTELTQLFQGYIVNEVDLNSANTCRENCNYYKYTKVHGCYNNLYCNQQRRCSGKVLKCQYIDSDMWICPSRDENRRYEYIEYENGKMYGKKGTCSKPVTKVDSWWRWLFWHCSYCMCYCDDFNSNSDRYFNLRDVTSDVLNNKVITGMRLTKVNQIIHIQIQEGKLLERGEIDNSSVTWKPVDQYLKTDLGVKNRRDYHTLTWEERAIDLDDLVAPEEHLLTGVRFRMVGAHLNFEIRVTPINFTSGLLIKPLEKSTWLSNDNTDFNDNEKRMEFVINKPDIPTRTTVQTKPDSKSNQFLNFGPTDLEKDAGQTTIPFLDIQPVESNPPFPLAGAGIFHKGRDGSGGYLALKVMTYDFTKHIYTGSPSSHLLVNYNLIVDDGTL